MPLDIPQDELRVIEEHLSARSHMPFEDKISIFKKHPITEGGRAKTQCNYPDIYVALVLTCGEKERLWLDSDGDMIVDNYHLYYKYELLPKLIKMREDGELTELKVEEEKVLIVEKKNKDAEDYEHKVKYKGHVDSNGNVTGWGSYVWTF